MNSLEASLVNVQKKFRERIIRHYFEIKSRYSKASYIAEYDTIGLSSGKFSEVILRFLQHELTGSYIPFGQSIKNFRNEADKLAQVNKNIGNDSIRIIIPQAVTFLYTLRNKRAIGHIGGDLEANEIDAATAVRIADWIICELIRIYHSLSIEEAQEIIDTLAMRNIPDVWEINGKKRILKSGLSFKQKALLLIYSEPHDGVMLEDLYTWTEYKGLSMFKKSVIIPLHCEKLVEYDQENDFVHISPKGIKVVEEEILKVY